MPASIRDIAEKVGKSITTVSRALHDYDDVSPQTKEMVRKAAEEMGYIANRQAQLLRQKTTETIGFILPTFGPRFSDPFFSEFLAGIGNKASDYGYDLLVSTCPPGDKEIKTYRYEVQSNRVDGFIIVRTRVEDARIKYLNSIGFPFVAFGRVPGMEDIPFVDENSEFGMQMIADYLVGLGHNHIACIAPSMEYTFAVHRIAGLKSGLGSHGIQLKENEILTGDLTEKGGYERAMELIQREKRPTAIVALNDLMAMGAISAIQDSGLAVGKDISVTGFDNIPSAAYTHPPLTTVSQPIFQIGGMVCEMLIRMVRQIPLEKKQILLNPSLIERQSTGAPLKQ